MAKKKKQSQQQQEMKRETEQYDGVLQEKQGEINKLKKSVDLLNGDLVRQRQIVSDMKKILDVQAKEFKEDIKKKTVKIIDDFDKNFNMLRKAVAEVYKEMEEAIEGLLVEKGLIEQKLVDSGKIIEELKREKNKIEKNRDDLLLKLAHLEKHQEVELDSGRRKKFKEISEEENVFADIETIVSSIEKQIKVLIDANKHLKSEVRSLKDNLKRVDAEKSEIQKQLKNALSELDDKSSKDLIEGVDADKGKQLNLRKRKIG
ncbi:trichoplein keratin filament-binding protein-like [Papaver somniferum]|uniref:trichoplein keratin filament-binding protein-like n=1 Tax=Papaver somniferum TaxID=3469 RepID=UPI000E6F76D3|nr:trichoplein keratin filament-binding protein-like [Papaver somniferum]